MDGITNGDNGDRDSFIEMLASGAVGGRKILAGDSIAYRITQRIQIALVCVGLLQWTIFVTVFFFPGSHVGGGRATFEQGTVS